MHNILDALSVFISNNGYESISTIAYRKFSNVTKLRAQGEVLMKKVRKKERKNEKKWQGRNKQIHKEVI